MSRRNTLKAGAAALALPAFGGLAAGSTTEGDGPVVRVTRSYDDPISYEEINTAKREQLSYEKTVNGGQLRDEVEPEFDEECRLVDFVSGLDSDGQRYQYWGAVASSEQEQEIHERASEIEQTMTQKTELTNSSVSTVDVSANVNADDEWETITYEQAEQSAHYGTLKHNIEWFRYVPDSSVGYNAFKQNIASIDDTTVVTLYDRKIDAEHEYDNSDLSNTTIHKAEPSSGGGGSVGVSIGLTGVSLSWSTPINELSHTLDTSGPTADWEDNLPYDRDTYWFYPGSTLKSDHPTCNSSKDLVVELTAQTDWGYVYDHEHTWNVKTYGCW